METTGAVFPFLSTNQQRQNTVHNSKHLTDEANQPLNIIVY